MTATSLSPKPAAPICDLVESIPLSAPSFVCLSRNNIFKFLSPSLFPCPAISLIPSVIGWPAS